MWGSNGVGVRLGGDLVAVTKVVSDSGCKMTMYGKGVLFAGMEKVLANHGLWFLGFFFQIPDFNFASIEVSSNFCPDHSASFIMWPHEFFFTVNIYNLLYY